MFKQGDFLLIVDEAVQQLPTGSLVRVLQEQKDFDDEFPVEEYEELLMITLPEYYDELHNLSSLELYNIWFNEDKSWIYKEESFVLTSKNHYNRTRLERL